MKKALKEIFEDDKTRTLSLGKILCVMIVLTCLAELIHCMVTLKSVIDIPPGWAALAAGFYGLNKAISNFSGEAK